MREGRGEGGRERGGGEVQYTSLLGEMTIKVHSASARNSFLSSCTCTRVKM